MKLKTLAATALVVLFGFSAPIYAAVIKSNVTIAGVEWSVSILEEASFESQSELLQSQPWWNSSETASAFSSAFGTADNVVDSGLGGLFAFEILPEYTFTLIDFGRGVKVYDSASDDNFFIVNDDVVRRYAVAEQVTPIPLPAGLPLLLTGLVAFVGLRKRAMRAAQV